MAEPRGEIENPNKSTVHENGVGPTFVKQLVWERMERAIAEDPAAKRAERFDETGTQWLPAGDALGPTP